MSPRCTRLDLRRANRLASIGSPRKKKRKYNLLIDLQKAYDSVDRRLLFRIVKRRCKNHSELILVELMEKLHKVSVIEVGSSIINAEMGLP